jgi:hypothetical protein
MSFLSQHFVVPRQRSEKYFHFEMGRKLRRATGGQNVCAVTSFTVLSDSYES